jgi:hypothetical protein
MSYMPWGKHRGRHIGDVPRRYLIWLIEEAERLDAGLRADIVDELLTRICRYREPPPPSRIQQVYRQLSLRFHPAVVAAGAAEILGKGYCCLSRPDAADREGGCLVGMRRAAGMRPTVARDSRAGPGGGGEHCRAQLLFRCMKKAPGGPHWPPGASHKLDVVAPV